MYRKDGVSPKDMSRENLVQRKIYLSEDENKRLKKDAYAHEMNVSEYLRWLIERERENAKKQGGN